MRQPLPVGVDDVVHVRRHVLDRDVPRPLQGGPAALRRRVGRPVAVVHLRGQPGQGRRRQDALDEGVALEHQLLAVVGAHALEDALGRARPVGPQQRRHDRLGEGQPPDAVGVPAGPVEAERPAPVVQHQGHPVAELQLLQQVVEERRVGGEPVGAPARVGQLVRLAHADQVGGDAPAQPAQVRDDPAPQVGRRRVAVQQHDRVAPAGVHVGHLVAADAHPGAGERVVRGGRHRPILAPSGPRPRPGSRLCERVPR